MPSDQEPDPLATGEPLNPSASTPEAVDQVRRELLREDRRSLWSADLESAKAFDKAILTLAAAGFGLSITIAKDFPRPLPTTTTYLLYATWAAFLTSLALTLISFQTSQKACRRQIADYEKHLSRNDPLPARNSAAGLTSTLNWISTGCLIMGALLLALFAAGNLGGNPMADEVKKGYVPPPAPAPLKEGYVPPRPPQAPPPEKRGYVPPSPPKTPPPPAPGKK
jgi:hypothetical protein